MHKYKGNTKVKERTTHIMLQVHYKKEISFQKQIILKFKVGNYALYCTY